ncbi:orphan sodium- and chloride-dependent neurotransmitter transporter NTT5-like isoform X26 [Canis lupus familiaris]|uniref:orphan sodium- and chloride-dependent neurotransmitter transporter NTT5-like isoform X26 n=1 Tax=Canis lupus familiaris TaxID=9615 RepID=UPI0015F133A6|nr:orphan sodium- and chloride-dependent neurotransmitter transporter NTT5-like isoform X26 [Canis lupus familiaris]
MESLEELSEEEAPKETKTSSSLPRKLTVKEILATKTQNYFAQTKKTKKTLMQVAFTIGLGSIWRFPYLCHRNGGGNFILMYFFMLLLFGIPLLYMEMIMGHWLRMDNIRVWKQLVPWLGGIGYASILVCILISLYNSIIITWSISYLGNSFDNSLPWNQCPLVKTINVTAWCLLFLIMITGLKTPMPMLIFTVFLPYILLFCFLIRGLFLEGATASLRHMVTTEFSSWASLDLWRQAGGHVLYSLGLGMGITISFSSYKVGEDNYIQVASLVALVNLVTSLLATSIIFIVLGFWTSTSGHSCVEKSILKLKNLIKRGMLPQDAKPPEDMLYLTTLDYLDWISKLPQYLQYQVIHFSPSCSIKMQKEKFMEGPGLAFVAFSQVISLFPGASFWAILFFLALVIMGLSTSIQILEGIVSPLQNSISTFRRYPKLLSVLICLGGFLGSLVFTSHAGSYIMSLFDDYLIPLTLVIIVTFQNVALACIYGARRVREEIFSDLGRLLWSFFIVLWCYVTLPGLLALTTIYFMQLYQMVPPYYIAWNSSMSQEVKQPYLQSTLGWVTFLSILTLLPIPVHPLYHWWYLQDHIASDPLEKLQPKKMPSVPPKPLQWPKHHLGKSQEKNSESSSKQLSLLLGRGLNLNLPPWQCSLPLSRSSQSSSWLSLPVITSLTSSFSRRSVSLPISRQVSPASVAVDNSELHTETKEDRSRMRTLFSNW